VLKSVIKYSNWKFAVHYISLRNSAIQDGPARIPWFVDAEFCLSGLGLCLWYSI